LAEAFGTPVLRDVALVFALLAIVTTAVFARGEMSEVDAARGTNP